jgi:uncharacterized membrane protein
MSEPRETPQDWPMMPVSEHVRRVEVLISNLLRVGVLFSVTLIVIGTTVSFVRHPSYLTSPAELMRLVRPEEALPHSLSDIATGLRDLRGQAIVGLGLLVLIATPMMRVAISVVAFLRERDRVYTAITLVVFCLLLLSLVLGKIE